MSKREKILDDIAQVAGGAIGAVHSAKNHAGEVVRSGVDALAHDFDLVPRDDFEKLESLVVTLREEQENLRKRIHILEEQLTQK
ncbi:MAG: accessory factor UbiK family protein [Alphaproteobacteria bacterium]